MNQTTKDCTEKISTTPLGAGRNGMTRKRTWGAGIKWMRTAWEAKFRMKVKAMSDSKSGELPSPPLNESSESVTLLNCC